MQSALLAHLGIDLMIIPFEHLHNVHELVVSRTSLPGNLHPRASKRDVRCPQPITTNQPSKSEPNLDAILVDLYKFKAEQRRRLASGLCSHLHQLHREDVVVLFARKKRHQEEMELS